MKTAIYREEGGEWRVNVLSDSVVDGFRVVSLECVEELRPSPSMAPIEKGERWDSSIRVGYENAICLWTIEEDDAT